LVVLGKVIDAVAAAEQLLADSERLAELHDVRPDILHLLTVLGFHGDEAIGYQPAEVEGRSARDWRRSQELGRGIELTSLFFPISRGQRTVRPASEQ